MALTESDIAQVLEAVKAESKSVESLETVGSLSGVKSLPGQKGDKLVNVPITLLSKPADDAAARAIAAAERVEELAPDGYLVAESITFKVMQMNDNLVVFIWQDGGWQKSSEGYLAMYDERTDTPVPLMKVFPQTGSIS